MPNTTGTDTRLAELKDWLSAYADQYELDLSTIRSASSDAGFRRYFRIDAAGGTRSYILMDAPPGKEDIRPRGAESAEDPGGRRETRLHAAL